MVLPMPEQNSASTEHALMQEITAPLGKLPQDPVPEVANVEFPIVLRGYDRLAVDAYVKRISQLVAELDASRSPQNAVRRALERVGEEVSGILQRAHDTAEQITSQSRAEAENRLDTARREAESLQVNGQRRLKELDAETDRIWEERHRIVEDARSLAAQLLTLAESAIQRFPAAEDLPGVEADAPISDVELPETEVAPPGEPGESGIPTAGDELIDSDESAPGQDTLPIEPPDPFDHESE